MKSTLLVVVLFCASAHPQQTNQATAVFIFPSTLPFSIHAPIFVDGVEVASLKPNNYLKMKIPAGEHTFASKRKEEGADRILEAGKIYYFRIRTPLILEPVSAEVGVYDEKYLPEQTDRR